MRKKLSIFLLVVGILFIAGGLYFASQFYQKPSVISVHGNIDKLSQARNISSASAKISIANFAKAQVVEVYDGDTIRTKDGVVIRYLGINSPEKPTHFLKKL